MSRQDPGRSRSHGTATLTAALLLVATPAAAQTPPEEPDVAKEKAAAPAEKPAPPPKPALTPEEAEQARLDAEMATADALIEAQEKGLATEGMEINPGDIVDVVVTSDRRGKRLQDYAGSASAFSQEDLDRVGVQSMREISNITPGVHVGTQEGNVEIYIRGVGSDNNTELGDPTAALHVDGVYIPRPRGLGAMFFDIERVEVNRGPQGTLRGRNATAGSLNIITAKPQFGAFASEVDAAVGTYSQRTFRAMVNLPVASTLAFRAAAYANTRDPFYENATGSRELRGTEDADELAYRLSGRWKPHDRVQLLVSHDFLQEKGAGYGGSNYAAVFAAKLDPNDIENPRRVYYRGSQAWVDSRHWGLTGTLNIDMGPVQLEAISGYRDLRYLQNTGSNAGVAFVNPNPEIGPPNLDNYSSSFWRTTSKAFVEELRLFAPNTARFRWSVGGFYFHEKQEAFLGTTADKSTGFAGVEFNMPNVLGKSYAAYADATFDITKKWRVLGGIRYTEEEKSRKGLGAVWQFDFFGMPHRFGTEGFQYAANGRTIYEPTATPFEVFNDGVARFGQRDTLPAQQMDPLAMDKSSITVQSGRTKDKFIDWRGGFEFDLTEDNLAYLTAATGHKSGGFNDNFQLPSGEMLAPTYGPERILAFELGSKNEFLGRKLRVNAAVFYYDYRDQVFQTIVPLRELTDEADGVAGSALRYNAARSVIKGAELETHAYLPWGFQAGVQALLLDARFAEGKIRDFRLGFGANDSPTVDVKDNFLPKSPRYTINLTAAQYFRTSFGWFDWIVSSQIRGKHYMTVFNGEGTDSMGMARPILNDAVPGYIRFDVGAGYSRPDGKARLELFVSNLTDVAYMTTLINTPGLNLRFFNPPRQAGLRLKVAF